MNRLILIVWLAICSPTVWGQSPAGWPTVALTDSGRAAQEVRWQAWQKDLYEMGVSVEHDSLRVSPVVRQLFTDSLLRQQVYPVTYTWSAAIGLMQQMALKPAFWHLINLYPTDSTSRTTVLQTVLAYDKLVDMNRAIVSSFYTYAFADPQVGQLRNGRPDIRHPDVLDRKLHAVREIVAYLAAYRKGSADKGSATSNR